MECTRIYHKMKVGLNRVREKHSIAIPTLCYSSLVKLKRCDAKAVLFIYISIAICLMDLKFKLIIFHLIRRHCVYNQSNNVM